MKRHIQIFLFISFIVGCSSYKQDIHGVYTSDRPNFLKKKWKYFVENYDSFITGTELQLKRDSTFIMTTCGNYLTGRWYTKNDFICLNYETNSWINDSLQKNGFNGKWPEVNSDTIRVKRRGKKLFFNWESNSNNKAYDVLKKIK